MLYLSENCHDGNSTWTLLHQHLDQTVQSSSLNKKPVLLQIGKINQSCAVKMQFQNFLGVFTSCS